jgi:hypothetical protein
VSAKPAFFGEPSNAAAALPDTGTVLLVGPEIELPDQPFNPFGCSTNKQIPLVGYCEHVKLSTFFAMQSFGLHNFITLIVIICNFT